MGANCCGCTLLELSLHIQDLFPEVLQDLLMHAVELTLTEAQVCWHLAIVQTLKVGNYLKPGAGA